MNACPNARPAIPGIRSATLDAHGNLDRADVIAVRTVYGETLHVDRQQLAGSRQQLTQYRKNGTLLGRFSARGRSFTHATTLHRCNIEQPAWPVNQADEE